MSELPSHGTDWAESEVLLDLITLYESWESSGDTAPDFTTVQQRLRESFDVTALRTLEILTRILIGLIGQELVTRSGEATAQSGTDANH
jgi:hypothetical protein